MGQRQFNSAWNGNSNNIQVSSKIQWLTTEQVDILIETIGSESQGQEEAACMHIIRPTQPVQRVIYMDDSSKFLKCFGLAAITAIT